MTAKKKSKPRRPPIYGVWRRMVDLETGEERLAIVAAHGVDRRLCRERGYRAGDEVRMELKEKRNVKFMRKAHGLGWLCAAQIEKFTGKSAHAVLKALQLESGVCCEMREIDLGELGKVMVKEARSLSFDDMEESEFEEFWKGIVHHLIDKYWNGLTPEQIEAQAEFFENDRIET